MTPIKCPCGGELDLDFKECNRVSQEAGIHISVYSCLECGSLYTLNKIGEKQAGFRTKQLLKNNKDKEEIPF